MTIDEAIRHCNEVAEQKDHESFIDRWSDDDEWSESVKEECRQCAAEHRQLAEWLTELKERRAADVQPVKHGRWIDIYEYCKMNDYKPSGIAVYCWCSECMEAQEKRSDFCPNCGADMRGEENE